MIINAFQSLLEGTGLDLRFSLSPQPATAQRASAGLFWYTAATGSLVDDGYQNGPNDRQVVGLLHGCPDPPGGHRDSDGLRPAESRYLLPVEWKSLIQSKLRLVDRANSTGLFLVTLLLSVTSILRSGLVLLSDLFFNKTTSFLDSSWSCLGHLAGESKLFI